jgi:hypothetical protein
MNRQFVAILGSPRSKISNSRSLLDYFSQLLEDRNWQKSEFHVIKETKENSLSESAWQSVEASQLVAISFPLYVDSLPANLTLTLEQLHAGKSRFSGQNKDFCILINCGFPESHHNDTAIRICRKFCQEMGWSWKGALSIGGGGVLGGEDLATMGGRGHKHRKAIELAVEALDKGESIPEKANDLLKKLVIPNWLYRWIGAYGFKKIAKKQGVHKKINARPYQPEGN